jgi:hypothetical protein
MGEDRFLAPDLAASASLIESGAIVEAAASGTMPTL